VGCQVQDLVIFFLFAILGMQIFFLVQKFTARRADAKEELASTSEVLNIDDQITPDTLNPVVATNAKENPEPAKKQQPPSKPKPEKAPDKTTISIHNVDASRCISCGLCLPVCPVAAITWKDSKAHIDESKCIGCGICANGDGNDFSGCPVKAISKK